MPARENDLENDREKRIMQSETDITAQLEVEV